MTVEECLKAAFAALVRGDLAERDRLCKLAEGGFRSGDEEVPGDTDVATGLSPYLGAQEPQMPREQIEPWMLDSLVNTIRQRLLAVPAELMTGFWDYDLPFTLDEREAVCGAFDVAGIIYLKLDVVDHPRGAVPPSYVLCVGRTAEAAKRQSQDMQAILAKHQKVGRGHTVVIVEHPPKLG